MRQTGLSQARMVPNTPSGGVFHGGPILSDHSPKSPTVRVGWMDSVRGFSVILVIVYHMSGAIGVEGDPIGKGISTFNAAVGALRMPAMVFLSGLLVPMSLRKGAKSFITGKLRRIAYPYFIWSAIMILLWTQVLKILPFRPRMLIEPLWQPFDHLWFLFFLLSYYGLALLTCRVRPLLIALASIPIAAVLGLREGGSAEELVFLASFFMLGVDVGTHSDLWRAGFRMWPVRLAGAGVMLGVVLAGGVGLETAYNPAFILPVAFSLAALWSVFDGHAEALKNSVLERVGRESLVFYIVHWPVVIIVRELTREGTWNWPARFVLMALATLGVCEGLLALRRRWPSSHLLFEWPARHQPPPRRVSLQTGTMSTSHPGV